MRSALARVAAIAGWLLVVVLLALWLVDAIHRGHLAGALVVGTGLAGTVTIPFLAARLRA